MKMNSCGKVTCLCLENDKTTSHAFLVKNTFTSAQCQVLKGAKRKVNAVNERHAEQRALLLQNPYITIEKQWLSLLL